MKFFFFFNILIRWRKEGRWTWTSSQLPFEVGLTGWTEGCGGQGGHGGVFCAVFLSPHTSLAVSFVGSRTELHTDCGWTGA